jgi:hypothetical protein
MTGCCWRMLTDGIWGVDAGLNRKVVNREGLMLDGVVADDNFGCDYSQESRNGSRMREEGTQKSFRLHQL